MGRIVRRVPLDFDWPLNKVWEGYLLPDRLTEAPCPDCEVGRSPAGDWLNVIVELIMMLPEEVPEWKNPRTDSARRGRLHPYLQSLMRRPNRPPTAESAELTGGLAGRPYRGPFGHDAIDQWSACQKIVEAAGLDPKVWGICPTCHGHAKIEEFEGQRAEAEAWESADPPEGEGWQLWETVSEGSPISPVVASADELAAWMSDPERGDRWVPTETARKFIEEGWAPTGVGSPSTGFVSGVEHVGWTAEEK